MKLTYPEGATPIDPDEQEGLIPTHITTREELNRWEQENINKAEEWCNSRKYSNILTIGFTLKLMNVNHFFPSTTIKITDI